MVTAHLYLRNIILHAGRDDEMTHAYQKVELVGFYCSAGGSVLKSPWSRIFHKVINLKLDEFWLYKVFILFFIEVVWTHRFVIELTIVVFFFQHIFLQRRIAPIFSSYQETGRDVMKRLRPSRTEWNMTIHDSIFHHSKQDYMGWLPTAALTGVDKRCVHCIGGRSVGLGKWDSI